MNFQILFKWLNQDCYNIKKGRYLSLLIRRVSNAKKLYTLGDKYLVIGPGVFKLPDGFKGNTKDAITKMLECHISEEKTKQYEITKK